MLARGRNTATAAVLLLCVLSVSAVDFSFPANFTLSLTMPNLPVNSSNTMTVAWDSLNNRAAIWNTQQLAPGTVLFDVSVAPPPSNANRIVLMGFNSVAGNHSTKQCCFHNITAAPLRPFWTLTSPINATGCFGFTNLKCFAGTKARYAPSSVASWCFDPTTGAPVCTVTLNEPYQPLWQVLALTTTTPQPSWFAFPDVFGSCNNDCDAP